jgi:hypothetical protein
MKKCELCDDSAIKGERFCKLHKAAIIVDLKSKGYLRAAPRGHVVKDNPPGFREIHGH